MSSKEQQAEVIFWLQWINKVRPGAETEILFVPNELGAIIINLN